MRRRCLLEDRHLIEIILSRVNVERQTPPEHLHPFLRYVERIFCRDISFPSCLRAPHPLFRSLTPPEPNTINTGDLEADTPDDTGIRAHTLTGGWYPGRCQELWSRECTVKPLCQMAWPLSVVRAALYVLALLMWREHFELSKPYNLVSLARQQQQHAVEHNNKGRAVELSKNLNLSVRSSEQEALAVLFPGIGWIMFENNG